MTPEFWIEAAVWALIAMWFGFAYYAATRSIDKVAIVAITLGVLGVAYWTFTATCYRTDMGRAVNLECYYPGLRHPEKP